MKFNIPKRMTVGGVDYVVNIKDVLNYNQDFGYWRPQGTIDIARGVVGDSVSESRMRCTFWHELTHAILDRMGRTDLNDSEEFVNTFSAFLSGAIDTMEE
nr:MAG TPA: Putative metallopeptidase [Caudoviricetes sp.]